MNPQTRHLLMHVSTATLTTVMFRLGLRNVFLQGVQRLAPGPNMVGPAYTLRYIPAREDLDVLGSFADRENPQRKGVEECPEGHIFIIDARGDTSAASAGCILATRLQARGCGGIVTDGGFRDSPEIGGLKIAAYHTRPSAPTNLTKHHAVALNDPIACGGVAVFPGDILVGDDEGIVCIPAHLAQQVAEEASEMTIFEDFVLEMVQDGASIFGLYPPTNPETQETFRTWRAQNHR